MKTLFMLFVLLLAAEGIAKSPSNGGPIQRDLSFWEKFKALLKAGDSYIYGDIDSYGLSWRSLGKATRFSWYGLRHKARSEVKKSVCKDFACAGYMKELAQITNARFAEATRVDWLTDMPAAFEKRWSLIDNAEESIYILTWGVYDDMTGTKLAEKILERLKVRPELDVRIIVDQKVALMERHRAVLQKMTEESEGKVKIIHWHTPQYRVHTQHRKLMVVDSEHVMLGGTNLGDTYSHIAGDILWKDADVYILGRGIGAQAHAQFAEIWNDQIIENPFASKLSKLEPKSAVEDGIIPMLLIDHNPGTSVRKPDHNILSAIYKLMADAKKTIDIENAYFILDPVMKDAIKKAVKRGVKIRIYTNSATSVDLPFLGNFIASSARKAMSYGAQVYLKRGATLHSKYMIVDGEIAMMGSHNMHPRSQAMDSENVVVVFDKEISGILQASFEEGLLEAFNPIKESQIDSDKSLIDFVYGTLLFDHL
jgi:cardiolipin synthase